MQAEPETPAHWTELSRQWALMGPPLRPSAEDVAGYTAAIRRWRGERPPRAAILGVTPELYRLPWPSGTDLLAVEINPDMIAVVWPGPREHAICADWRAMPLASGARDLVVCDGGLIMLAYPREQQRLVRELHRVLAPGGLAVFRSFVPPQQSESPETVLADLLAGRFPSLNALKLRLGMAMQADAEQGVALRDVWDAVHNAEPDWRRLAERAGWTLDHLRVIDAYRGRATRYHFASVDQVKQTFCRSPGGFSFETIATPAYPLGERCPIMAFRRM